MTDLKPGGRDSPSEWVEVASALPQQSIYAAPPPWPPSPHYGLERRRILRDGGVGGRWGERLPRGQRGYLREGRREGGREGASLVFRLSKASHVKRQNHDLSDSGVCMPSEVSRDGDGKGKGKGVREVVCKKSSHNEHG